MFSEPLDIGNEVLDLILQMYIYIYTRIISSATCLLAYITWRFPQIGLLPMASILDWDFPCPASLDYLPMYGNPHIVTMGYWRSTIRGASPVVSWRCRRPGAFPCPRRRASRPTDVLERAKSTQASPGRSNLQEIDMCHGQVTWLRWLKWLKWSCIPQKGGILKKWVSKSVPQWLDDHLLWETKPCSLTADIVVWCGAPNR